MPLGQESIEVLERVKRGTLAKFVLITKGIKIVSLDVYRKGSMESAKKRARESGMGEISFGAVEGKGPNIAFKLARADGFEKPPTKDLTLRAFLSENNLDFKPTIEIVDVLPPVVMDDEEAPQSSTTKTQGPQQGGPQLSPPRPPLTPPQPPERTPPRPRGPVYRTQQEWDAILASIEKATDETNKQQRLDQAVAGLKGEREQIKNDTVLAGDPNGLREQNGIHMTVAQSLKSLSQRPLPTKSTPPQGGPPQPPDQRSRGPQQPTPPPRREPGLSENERARKGMVDDTERRVNAYSRITAPYTQKDLQNILERCETDGESDFGQVCRGINIAKLDTYEELHQSLTRGRTLALKYIKDHPEPKIGKLPARVQERISNCKIFATQFDQLLGELQKQEDAARSLIQTYDALLKRKEQVPYGVADQLRQMLVKNNLSKETQAELKRLADEIQALDKPRGYEELAQLDRPTDLQKGEILLSHGCFKSGGGGNSDVRLLQNPDKSVAFAFKGARGEAFQGLDFLKLPPGASTTREDLCSTVTQGVLSQTGLDLGFPKSKAVKIAGQTGALIDGIRGQTVDPEDKDKYRIEGEFDPRERDEYLQRMEEMPDKITAKSLQKLVLFSAFTCQWDCKWANMMVEEDNNARPIDGGCSFPTQDTIDGFAKYLKMGQVLPLEVMTQYPRSTKRAYQTLPQAMQPMDQETVDAILKIDVNALLSTTKQRRDQIVRELPDLAPPPHNGGLVDDGSLDRVTASIRAAQDILRRNRQISLADFAKAYVEWWKGWIPQNATPQGTN